MNENSKRLQTLEAENKAMYAENKELQTKVELLTTSTTPPPGFGHVRYEVNANPSSTPRQMTSTRLTSNTRHPIFELRSIASDPNLAIPKDDQAPKTAAIDLTG
ncbi:hypothetical protein ACOSQ3_010052 [Xanthoceras sorbifolium]